MGFWRFFIRIFFPRRLAPYRLVSKDVKFSFASFYQYKKTSRGFPPTQTPTQKLKIGFSLLGPHEICSSLISFLMILEALQAELFRLMFHALSSKFQKIPEFSLSISYKYNPMEKLLKVSTLQKFLNVNGRNQR